MKLKNNAQTIIKTQQYVVKAFIDIIAEKKPFIAKALDTLFSLPQTSSHRQERENVYKDIQKLPPLQQIIISDYYAKITDISRRVRKVKNSHAYEDHKQEVRHLPTQTTSSADNFAHVFAKLAKHDVSPADAKQFFEENCLARFSLTAHPTNPTTVAYTEAGVAFERQLEGILSKPSFSGTITVDADFKEALRSLRDLPITGPKKTTTEEMHESIRMLDVIYDSVDGVYASLRTALERYPQYRNVIDTTKPLIEACTWATGDGDGNDNVNIAALTEGISLLQGRIKQRYLAEIDALIAHTTDGTLKSKLSAISHDLHNPSYTPEHFIKALETVSGTESLVQKVRVFGFHYAKIDIRHNAEDIMVTLARAAFTAGLISSEKAFLKAPDKDQHTAISHWFQDPASLSKLQTLQPDDLGTDKAGKTASRIWGRLQVVGQNPTMSDKLIIADTKTPSHALAALLLLKGTGNVVAEAGTRMDIVTLSESVPDLEELPQLIGTLLDDPIYRSHISHRGRVVPMIAKSDTVRRNGMGALTKQEEALGTAYAVVEERARKYHNEIGHITVEGYNGGGAALQRGGGRITETAHNARRSATRYGNGSQRLGPITMTIQGHQMQLVFTPELNASQTLEALAGQNLYARAQIEGKAHIRTAPPGVSEPDALARFEAICQDALTAYTQYIGDPDEPEKVRGNPSFNELFYNAPWVSVILGNLSSRPAKRGGSNGGDGVPTVRDIKGDAPQLLNNRAITVERLAAHSGTHLLTYLGILEGLEKHSTKELYDMYDGSKSARDLMRNLSTALHMTDFHHSWQMLIGEERPDTQEIERLAQAFEQRKFNQIPHENTAQHALNRETLAWMECYALKVAQCVYRSLTGQEHFPKDFSLQTPLKVQWPELAAQLTAREAEGEFPRFMEAQLTRYFNENPDAKLTPGLTRLTQNVYAAADVLNTPEGLINVLTRDRHCPQMQAKL